MATSWVLLPWSSSLVRTHLPTWMAVAGRITHKWDIQVPKHQSASCILQSPLAMAKGSGSAEGQSTRSLPRHLGVWTSWILQVSGFCDAAQQSIHELDLSCGGGCYRCGRTRALELVGRRYAKSHPKRFSFPMYVHWRSSLAGCLLDSTPWLYQRWRPFCWWYNRGIAGCARSPAWWGYWLHWLCVPSFWGRESWKRPSSASPIARRRVRLPWRGFSSVVRLSGNGTTYCLTILF